MTSASLALLSATDLLRLYRSKQLSPVEATEAVLDRIAARNGPVNAMTLVDGERALADARAAEARWQQGEPKGLLDGVPATIKDLVLTAGWPTLRGSRTVDPDQPWTVDAPATARLREAGAVLVGKTTTPEFGWKGVTDSPLAGITRNPWNRDRTPGGSSGGAAAAAALGFGALHIGTDGGGSIRIPAGFTGIYGLKPSFGRVPAFPASPFGSVSHVGPMTRTVADAALMLTVISRPDARDWQSLPPDGRDYRIGLEDGVAGLRIGYVAAPGGAPVDPGIAALVDAAAAAFADLGARVEPMTLDLDGIAECFHAHWCAGAASLLSTLPAASHALIDPGLRAMAEAGAALSMVAYQAQMRVRAEFAIRLRRLHETTDLLLMPTLPVLAFAAGQDRPDPASRSWADWTPFSYPFNLTQQPAATIPCGFVDGLPAGLQIVGPAHRDDLVLRASRAYEGVRPIVLPA